MENILPETNVIHIPANSNIISLKHNNGMSLTVCFCQCDCECHKNTTNDNNNNFKKIINNNNQNDTNNNYSNINLNSIQKNSFPNNLKNPIKKEYSFDYNNHIITDINPNLKESLTKETTDKKMGIENINDYNYEDKIDDYGSKISLASNHGYEDLFPYLDKNKEYNNYYNNSNKQYIFYNNDNLDNKKFINTLHEIKNKERRIPRCSSLKDFNKYNNKYLYNNKSNNYSTNNFRNNNIKYNNDNLYNKNYNKNNINIIYDNNNFIQNRMKYDNNLKKIRKNLSMEYRCNENLLNNNYDNINKTNKTSHSKNKIKFSENYVGNRLFDYNHRQKNNSLYNNIESYTSTNRKTNANNKNKINNYSLNDYNEKNIEDNYNDNNYDNKYNYLQSDEIEINQNTEIDNNLNPLGHIVDNFITMLKNKNLSKNRINQENINMSNCKTNISKLNIPIPIQNINNKPINTKTNTNKEIINKRSKIKPYIKNNLNNNKYNDNIMKKKKKLDNICYSKNKPNNISTYNQYKCKDYSSIEYKIKNIENKNKKNLIGQNEIKEKMQEYEKKYGKNNNSINSKKSFNNNDKISKIEDNDNDNDDENNISGIYNNSRIYKFNKYKEEKILQNKKNIKNYSSEKNENINKINKNNINNNLIENKNNKNYYTNINNNNYENNKDNNLIIVKDYNNNNINIQDNSNIIIKNENNDNLNIKDNKNINNKLSNNQLKNNNNDYSVTFNPNHILSKKDDDNNIENENNNLIQQNENKNELNNQLNDIDNINIDNNNIQNIEIQLTPYKLISNNIEIQSLSNLSYNPSPMNNINSKNEYIMTKRNESQLQILSQPTDSKDNIIETVPERVKKLIYKRAILNYNNLSLSSKLNLDTNLSLSDENEKGNYNVNIIQRNINISPKSIFTIYHDYEKPIILAFDIENKTFSFQDYSDFGNFEENYKLSLNTNSGNNNSNNGNLYITIDTNLYIITGKNHDMLYMFNSIKKTITKLCSLKNNHSNGTLIKYEDNIICLSGDYNKKVEMYSIYKNEWTDLPEMLIERSNSSSCIMDNRDNKYILNLFGFNSQTKEYLNTIEYLIINKSESYWTYLNYNNSNLLSLNINNFFCINYDDTKIIIIGGYNETENINIEKFIQIIFEEGNFEKNIIVEETERKLKDIDKNKKYLFCNGYNNYLNNDKNEIFYEVFDSEFNCHLFQRSNMVHDIFYFHC